MAKAPKQAVDAVRVKLLEDVIAEVTEHMRGTMHEVDGTIQAPVYFGDTGYRVKPINPRQEFFFVGGYVGATGDTIWKFEPADAQEWQHAEFNDKKLDTAMPLFASGLQAALTYGPENMPGLVQAIAEELVDRKRKQAAHDEAVARTTYENNPLFGRF